MKIAGVGWWSAGGGGARYGEREREKGWGRDGSFSLRMHNRRKKEAKQWDEIRRLLFTHTTKLYKPEKSKTRK